MTEAGAQQTWSPQPSSQSLWCGKLLCRLLKDKCGHQHNYKNFDPKNLTYLQYVLEQQCYRTQRNSQEILDLILGSLHKKEPTPNIAWVTEEQKLEILEIYGKAKHYWFKKNSIKLFLKIFSCTHSPVLYIHHQRGFFTQPLGTEGETHRQMICEVSLN